MYPHPSLLQDQDQMYPHPSLLRDQDQMYPHPSLLQDPRCIPILRSCRTRTRCIPKETCIPMTRHLLPKISPPFAPAGTGPDVSPPFAPAGGGTRCIPFLPFPPGPGPDLIFALVLRRQDQDVSPPFPPGRLQTPVKNLCSLVTYVVVLDQQFLHFIYISADNIGSNAQFGDKIGRRESAIVRGLDHGELCEGRVRLSRGTKFLC